LQVVVGAVYSIAWAAVQTVCTALTLPIAIGMLTLLAWNLYLLYQNKTTIEYHEVSHGLSGVLALCKLWSGARFQLWDCPVHELPSFNYFSEGSCPRIHSSPRGGHVSRVTWCQRCINRRWHCMAPTAGALSSRTCRHRCVRSAADAVVCRSRQGVTALIQARKSGGGAYEHPYDLGLCNNLYSVFGARPATWMFPETTAATGNGLSFPTAWDAAHDDLALGLR
jgi:hypothetical protein